MALSDIKKADLAYTGFNSYKYKGLDLDVEFSNGLYTCVIRLMLEDDSDCCYTLGKVQEYTVTDLKSEIKDFVGKRTAAKLMKAYQAGEILNDAECAMLQQINETAQVTKNTINLDDQQLTKEVRDVLMSFSLCEYANEILPEQKLNLSLADVKAEFSTDKKHMFYTFLSMINNAVLYICTNKATRYRYFSEYNTDECVRVIHDNTVENMTIDEMLLRKLSNVVMLTRNQVIEMNGFINKHIIR